MILSLLFLVLLYGNSFILFVCALPLNASLSTQQVKEPRLISDWLYYFQLVVLLRGLGIGLREIVDVADQIVDSALNSGERSILAFLVVIVHLVSDCTHLTGGKNFGTAHM